MHKDLLCLINMVMRTLKNFDVSMNFNRLIDLGRGDGFGSIGENFSRKLRGVCLNRKVLGFQRVEFFFGEMPERVLFDAYTVSNCQIQTSSVTRLFLSFVVRFQRET